MKKKATKVADVEFMPARSTLCGEREANSSSRLTTPVLSHPLLVAFREACLLYCEREARDPGRVHGRRHLIFSYFVSNPRIID